MPKKTYNGPSNQSRSSVTLGNEAQYGGSSTWKPETSQRFNPTTVAQAEPYHNRGRSINGNASKIKFDVPGAPPVNYASVNAEEFGPNTSVHNQNYVRAAPAEGFDRETANRTNYELGETPTVYQTAVEQSTQNPKNLPSPGGPTFPALGLRDYNPHNCAGYRHNVVTGKHDPHAKDRPLPKRFESNDKDLYGNLVGVPREGQMHYYDLTVGRTRAKPVPGKNLLEKEVAEPPLDSLVCLRPPLEGDRRLY